MTAIVVYNPSESPVYAGNLLVDGLGWRFIEDASTVSQYIENGTLVVPVIPERGSEVSPEAYPAISAFWEDQDTSGVPAKSKSRKVRDTESAKDTSTNESEA